jgi:predicted Zn-dependent peptidase
MQKPLVFKINQAKIVLYPIKQFPTVHINIFIKAGSWYEPGTQWGAFHYLEHLIFQGSKRYTTNQELENIKQNHGINFNGSTGGSDMNFYLSLPDFKIKPALEIIDQFIFHPTFNSINFPRELSVIAQEYYKYWDNPYNRFYQKSNENILGEDNFLNRNGIGQPEFIKGLSQNDLIKLHSQYFQPQNITISVTGNFDSEKIKKSLDKILNQKVNDFTPKLSKTSFNIKQKNFNYQDKTERSDIFFSWVTKNKFSYQEKICLNMASFIFARSTNSILFQKLRQEQGLVYDINSNFTHSKDINFFEIWSSSEDKNINRITDIIQSEVKKFLQSGIEIKKFNQIRQFMNYRTLMGNDSVSRISYDIGRQLFYDGKIRLPQEVVDIANDITLHKFMTTIKKIIIPQETIISTLTPIKPEQ